MTSERLAFLAGALISLACSYLPGLKTKWADLPSESKRLIMGGLMLAVAGTAFGLGCAGIGPITCDQPSLLTLGTTLIYALVANKTTYDYSPAVISRIRTATAGAASASNK